MSNVDCTTHESFFVFQLEGRLEATLNDSTSALDSEKNCWLHFSDTCVIMQIYIFIVCNHATEPTMYFLCLKSQGRRRRRRKHEVTAVAVVRSRRGCCGERHGVRSDQQGLALR